MNDKRYFTVIKIKKEQKEKEKEITSGKISINHF